MRAKMKDIYLDVEKSIKDLQSIFKNADGRDEKLKRFNQEALEVFQKLERESLKELESLKNNEEWENFTIAFYGETGAGKSTLIECLRMFFKEQSKVDQQERFKRLYSTYQYNHQNFILLDVPGIEGSEKKVIDQISNATQKAHAIFMLPKRLILRKKEKKGKGERLKKSKNSLIRKQRYGRFSTNRLIAQEP
ncbi:putative [Helicobacter pylori J99]|uniref:Putative n=2 Tax=Helicobacter pylori TaxID=210 RepID=Q9ZLB0_HELPJ|nr:putative [Helicobacter pylori J99]